MENKSNQRDNSGVLFKADKTDNDRAPQYKGNITVAGKDYWISAWVKEKNALPAQTTYSNASIAINNYNYLKTCLPQGQIIDGWQRIEDTLKVVQHGKLKLLLKGGLNGAYFDDIRIYPTDGSAITYVYDPLTLRLMAELDERNYAKLYEYDEEGKLIRVKKETEKGIMTIQENRENSSKND